LKITQLRWLALIALSAIACRTNHPADSSARPIAHADQSAIAEPTSDAQNSATAEPEASERITLTPAMPTLPAKSEVAPMENAAVGSRAERLSALESEHEKAMDAFYDLYRNAKSDEERQKIAETTTPPDVKPFQARVRALLAEDATDMTAFGALKWLLSNSEGDATVANDIALLDRHHFERPEMIDALMSLQYARDAASSALLTKLAEKSPHKDIRGRAWMAKAEAAKEEVSTSAEVRGLAAGPERDEYVAMLGQAEVDRLSKLDSKVAEARVVAIYETVVRDYADVPAARKGVIGDQANAAMFEMQSLVVGKIAPEIAAEDLDGIAFKLSDYRGKVVMLDFWGHW